MATRTIANAGGNWSALATWVEGVVPTSADDVVATATSGQLTIDTLTAACQSFDLTGYLSTLTMGVSQALAVGSATGGKFILPNGMTLVRGSSFSLSFVSTSNNAGVGWPVKFGTTQTNLPNTFFNGVGGKWQFQDSGWAGAASGSYQLINGSLDCNGQTFSIGAFSANNTNVRALALGAANITLTSSLSGAGWNLGTSTNLTFTAGTSTINHNSPSSTTFAGAGQTYNNVIINQQTGSTPKVTFNSPGNTFANLTFNGANVAYGQVVFFANQTVTGTLTVAGNATYPLLVWDSLGVSDLRSTITLTVNGSTSLSNATFQNISPAGTAAKPWTGTRLGNGGNNTNITFDSPRTVYWVATAGGSWSASSSWSTSSGGVSGALAPLPQDTANIDANSISATGKTITIDTAYWGGNVNFTGVTNTPSVSVNNAIDQYIWGSLTLVAGMTLGTASNWYLLGYSGIYTLTTAGNAFCGAGGAITIDPFSGTYQLQDALSTPGTVNFDIGTLDANGQNVTCKVFNTNGGNSHVTPRTLLMKTGTWTVTGTGTAWNAVDATTILTLTPGSSTIVMSDTSVTAKTFAGAGKTYNNLQINGAVSAAAVSVTGANTFNNITGHANAHLTLPSSTTTTISSLTSQGTAGNLFVLDASTANTAATLRSTIRIGTDFLSVKDSTASGSTPFYAGANGVLISGDTNWLAQAVPSSGTPNLLLMGIG